MQGLEAAEAYMTALREAAERYLEMGWSVIPVSASTKTPSIAWSEYQTRQPTDEEVADWFDNGVPDGNGGTTRFFSLGIVTGAVSKLVVLDCDNQDALSYALGECALWSPLGVKTTRGQHLYFRHPNGGSRVMNKVGGGGIDWPDIAGLDLRGDGGYVIAPPSAKFDKDGHFVHQYAFTMPDRELLDAWFSAPGWPGITVRQRVPAPTGEFTLENLTLDGVRSYGASVWDSAAERVKKLGHKMRDGDGRNAWLTRYIGECVASGMDEGQARVAAGQFSEEFFEVELPKSEVEATLRSIINIDRRNHPEKYEPAPGYVNQTPERARRHAALRVITPSSLAELRRMAAGQRFLIDPYIAPQSICQVAGFNGHGKSLFLLNLMWAAASGQSFGPAVVTRPLRVLYLDGESGGATLAQRIGDCESMIGPMRDELTLWCGSVSDLELNFSQAESYSNLQQLLTETRPQIVVIDTVRTMWSGMEENSPHAWTKVNNLAVALRNAGMSVVLVHHRNKPGPNGMGREAGSTAQLKDLDTQMFVTKVTEDEDQARREAALPDSATQVVDFSGVVRSAYSYLRLTLPAGYQLQVVFEVTFGKLRSATENHVPAYIGFAQHMKTGSRMVVSTKTPRQKAMALRTSRNMGCPEIAEALQVPLPAVERWLNEDLQARDLQVKEKA